ncbi:MULTISPECIES: hypothetical protein [Pantoea]|uniref:hypothetical protein n=1 Tax=Pantoea TaxID=53335 RepID=UPI00257FBC08|nr:hypothetical protein [Pantoea sp. UBA5960]
MEKSKLMSTLKFVSVAGESYKYEIYQDYSNSNYYAVISSQQEIETEKYGRRAVWVEINSYLRLAPLNPDACEEECKAHFANHVRN